MFTFWKYKKEELYTTTLTLFSYYFLYSLALNFLFSKNNYSIFSYFEPIGIITLFGSQIFGILLYFFLRNNDSKFNAQSLIIGLVIGVINFVYYVFFYEYPQPCKGVSFTTAIILYLLIFKPKLNSGKLCLSLFLIIFFTFINYLIFFRNDPEIYDTFLNINMGKHLIEKDYVEKKSTFIIFSAIFSIFLAGQFMAEKFLVEKGNIDPYLLMGFEGIGSFVPSLIYYLSKDKDIFKQIEGNNTYLIFFFVIIYCCYNLNRFYLSKYTNLCQNIFVFELAKFFFYYNIFMDTSSSEIGYLLSSLAIFLGMAIFNELIGFSKFNTDDNENNSNNYNTSLIDQSKNVTNNTNSSNNVLNNNNSNNENNNYSNDTNSNPNINTNNIIIDNNNNDM